MRTAHDQLPPSPFGHPPQAPRGIQADDAQWRVPAPAWRPDAELLPLHDPVWVASLWRRVLAVVRSPLQIVEAPGPRAVQVCGVIRLVQDDGGGYVVQVWQAKAGHLAWVPCPDHDVALQALPAGWEWLNLIRNAAKLELGQQQRSAGLERSPEALDRYTEALFSHLRHALTRHADLRQMRTRIRHALPLDPDAVRLARRMVEVETSTAGPTLHAYKLALRHKPALLKLEAELPQLVPLYAAMADRAGFHHSTEPARDLRDHLLQQGLMPRTWRLIVRSHARMWLPVRQFYCGGAATALLDYLRILEALGLNRAPSRWMAWCLLAQVANPGYRHPKHLHVLQRYIEPLSHAARQYEGLSAAAQATHRWDLAGVVLWVSLQRPALDKQQRRAGWPWLLAAAARWGQEQVESASDSRWEVPFRERETDGHLVRLIGSARELRQEGQAMHHCIGTYVRECVAGDAIVASIRLAADPDKRVATALLQRVEGGWKLAQIRGIANTDPPARAQAAAACLVRWVTQAGGQSAEAAVAEPAPPDWPVVVGRPPEGSYPAYMPPNARLIAEATWSWSAMHSRVVRYQLSGNRDGSLWILWARYFDEYNERWKPARPAAYGEKAKSGPGQFIAAERLLMALWASERDADGLDRFHDLTDASLLPDSAVHELADEVWPQE